MQQRHSARRTAARGNIVIDKTLQRQTNRTTISDLDEEDGESLNRLIEADLKEK